MITFSCPQCENSLFADSDQIGQTITCARCGQTATVADPQATSEPNFDDMEFVTTNGSELNAASATRTPVLDSRTCRMCGYQILESVTQCPNCGELLTESAAADNSGVRPPYRSAATLATMVMLFFAANALVTAASGATSFQQWSLLNDAKAGQDVQAALEFTDSLYAVIGICMIVGSLVGTIVFLMWIYRANKNARALGATGMQFTPGWSVGWFFIPFMNLWKPFQVVKEIWRASHSTDAGATSGGAGLIAIWWAAWIFNSLVDRVAGALATAANDVDSFIFSRQVNLLAMVVNLTVIVLTVAIVHSITSHQTQRDEALART